MTSLGIRSKGSQIPGKTLVTKLATRECKCPVADRLKERSNSSLVRQSPLFYRRAAIHPELLPMRTLLQYINCLIILINHFYSFSCKYNQESSLVVCVRAFLTLSQKAPGSLSHKQHLSFDPNSQSYVYWGNLFLKQKRTTARDAKLTQLLKSAQKQTKTCRALNHLMMAGFCNRARYRSRRAVEQVARRKRGIWPVGTLSFALGWDIWNILSLSGEEQREICLV